MLTKINLENISPFRKSNSSNRSLSKNSKISQDRLPANCNIFGVSNRHNLKTPARVSPGEIKNNHFILNQKLAQPQRVSPLITGTQKNFKQNSIAANQVNLKIIDALALISSPQLKQKTGKKSKPNSKSNEKNRSTDVCLKDQNQYQSILEQHRQREIKYLMKIDTLEKENQRLTQNTVKQDSSCSKSLEKHLQTDKNKIIKDLVHKLYKQESINFNLARENQYLKNQLKGNHYQKEIIFNQSAIIPKKIQTNLCTETSTNSVSTQISISSIAKVLSLTSRQ